MAEILQFIAAIKLRLGILRDVRGLRDPLAAIVEIVKANRHTPEARTLAAVVVALWANTGKLSENAVYTLDRRSCALVAALFEDRVQGRYSKAEWLAALEEMAGE